MFKSIFLILHTYSLSVIVVHFTMFTSHWVHKKIELFCCQTIPSLICTYIAIKLINVHTAPWWTVYYLAQLVYRKKLSKHFISLFVWVTNRCLMGSTDQADPSCFYLRISWILMEQLWFYFFCPLHLLQSLRNIKNDYFKN